MNKKLSAGIILVLVIAIAVIAMQKKQTKMEDSNMVIEERDLSSMDSKDLAMEMEKMEPGEDDMMKKMDEAMMEKMMEMTYLYQGSLADVTEGKSIRGTSTGRAASGMAKANFADGTYSLLATFDNLPDPAGDDFYEGWIVRKSPFNVISTGELEKVDGKYRNVYTSGQDLTDHNFYVLTLEPNDGDPAPADHIVEGTLEK